MSPDSKFIIRTADGDDVDGIARFNINMAMETESKVLEPEIITAGVRGMIENPGRGFYLVVEQFESGVSTPIIASLMVTTEWSDWRNGMFWWIQSVYVLPEWRRNGLYRMLYLEVKNLATKADNICGFRLYVERDNVVAQKTYDALGMDCTHYHLFEELYDK